MSNRLKKILAILIITAYIFSFFAVGFSQPSDVTGNPAATWINKWISKGLVGLQPDGTFKPNDPLKRVEFFQMINKVFNYTDKADATFTDVIKGSPYADDISKAVAAGYLKGDKSNKVYPFALIKKVDAAQILTKVFELQSNGKDIAGTLSDEDRIPAENSEAVNIMLEKNYMGPDEANRFNPYNNITRAEAIMIIDKIMGDLYNQAGTYSGGTKLNVIVNTGGVVLKNMTINGDLYLTEGVGSGTVTLEGVSVKGRAIIHGGGPNSVLFKSSSVSGDMIVNKKDGKIRLSSDGYSEFPSVIVGSGASFENSGSGFNVFTKIRITGSIKGQEVSLKGNYANVSVESPSSNLLVGGSVNKLDVNQGASDSNIRVSNGVTNELNIQAPRTVVNLNGGSVSALNLGNTSSATKISVEGSFVNTIDANSGMSVEIKIGTVNKINIEKGAEGSSVQISKNAGLTQLNAYAGLEVKGQGSVGTANIYSNGVSIEQQPSSTSIQGGINANIGNSTKTPVSSLSINASDLSVQKGGTIAAVVTVIPSDATLIYSSNNPNIATVDPKTGIITGVGSGTATIVVTGAMAGYFNSSASFKVTVLPVQTVSGGVLAMDVNNAIVGATKTITLTYTPGEATSNGTINFILPLGFAATTNDTVNIASTGAISLNANQVINGGQKVSITGATLGTNQTVILVLKDKVIPSAGIYNFKATLDSDGSGPKVESSGTGTETKQFESIGKTVIWSATTFTEAAANDGSISNTINLTLNNETFANGPFVSGTHYTVTNVPAGLTVSINRTGNTTATVTLTGNATNNDGSDSINNLGISFTNAAFTSGNAALITGASKTNISVSFNNPDGATITSVSAINANGYYKAGDIIHITVTFSKSVDVTSAPAIILETGTTDEKAVYQSGTGTSMLTFDYTVQQGDTSGDLDCNSLVLNGGTIKNTGNGINAVLTLPAQGTTGSLGDSKAIVIDTTAPTGIRISAQNNLPGYGSIILTAVDGPLSDASWALILAQIKANTNAGSSWITGVAATDLSIVPSADGVTASLNNANPVTASIKQDFVITAANITDRAGNTAAADITVDAYLPPAPATITGISSTNADGSYKAGSVIHLTVTFNKSVDVTGTPQLSLETGSTTETADFISGTGTATLTFDYTVKTGDVSSDLDYTSPSALSLNGGTIQVSGSIIDAGLILPAPGTTGSLSTNKNIIIDTAPPSAITISSQNSIPARGAVTLTAVDGPLSNASWNNILGQIKTNTGATGTWITGITSGNLTITPSSDGVTAILANGNLSNPAVIVTDFIIDAANITDKAGNNAASSITIDAYSAVPTVTSVDTAISDGSYNKDEQIDFTVTFDQSVAVDTSKGTPVLLLETGAVDRNAIYQGGTGTTTLTFRYIVQSNDTSPDLDYKSINSLMLSGGTIKTVTGLFNADIVLPAVGTFSGVHAIVIDTTPPTAINISVQNIITAGGSLTLTAVNGPLTGASWNAILNQIKANTAAGSNWITGILGTDLAITPSADGITAVLSNNNAGDATITTDFVITAANIIDIAGNTATGDITIDSYLPPAAAIVTGVTATTSDGSYKANDVIHITVTFDKAVDVTGVPVLNLETGLTDRNAVYVSGSGSTILTFDYTVQAGDSSLDLDYISNTSLNPGTGSIKNKNSSVNATLILPLPGVIGSIGNSKDIIIDTVSPTFSASGGLSVDSTHKVVTMVFSEDVVNNESNITALKNDITFAADGTTFVALGALDTVAVTGGNVVITFNTAITGSTNKIKIAANALKDTAGNVKTSVTSTNTIDASADISPPAFTGASLDPTHKIVTLTFNEAVVNNKSDLATLKSQITFAANGVNFAALGTSDSVSITGGNLVITFNSVITGANNTIKINANSLKDSIGNVKFDVTVTGAIDASSDIAPPIYVSAGIDPATHKIVTLNFNENIVNNKADLTSLKAEIQIATNGSTYSLLSAADSVSISGNGLIITFNSALNGALNKIKVNANALRDSTGNIKSDITVTEAVDASADIIPPVYNNSSLDGTHKIITITFNEALANNKADLTALKAEISVATDGSIFTPLGATDSVVISGSSIIVTLNNVLTGNTNKVQINANALKDIAGNVKTDVTVTGAIDASADITPPTFNPASGTSIDATHKIVTMAFSEAVVNNKSTIALLKAEITLATNGSSFTALGSSDTVTITGGSLVITFNSALTGNTNVIKINANALKDVAGNVKQDITQTNSIDASADITAPTFNATSGTSIDATHKIVTMTFSETVVNNKADITALKAEITFASNGTSYVALGGSDTVAITAGNLVITFNSVLTGATNKIKVNAGALKDVAGNVKSDVTQTNAIDASTDVTAPTLVSAVVNSANTDKLILTYDEGFKNVIPDIGDYTIGGADAGGRNVTAVVINTTAKAITLTLSSGISNGNNITVSYAKGTNPLQDAAGNTVANLVNQPVTNNVSSSAGISQVTSSNADGTYKTGQTISITVNFSNAVDVTGSPVLHLETGTTDHDAVYASGTGTVTLTFNYVIQSGDTSSDLEYININSLALSGGTIRNKGTTIDANLTLPTPGNSGSLGNSKAIVIDTTPPVNSAAYPKAGANTDTTASIIVQTNENGKVYYVVLATGAVSPSALQVKAGTDSLNGSLASNMKGSISLTKDTDATINLSTLSVSSNYDVYIVCEDSAGNLQASPVKLQITTSVLVLSSVGVDVANNKITNTTAIMQYSLDSTNGTNGTWTDCSTGSSSVTFVAGNVYVREKANPLNFALVANIAPAAAAPDVSGITYSVLAGTITIPVGSPVNQYNLAGGAWTDITAGTTSTGITFVSGDIQFRIKATSSKLTSFVAVKATVPAPTSAPNLYSSDVSNTISGLDATYEYRFGAGPWISGDIPGDFSGTITVQVRLKATAATLPSQIQTLNFTSNLNMNGVGMNVAAGQITGTTTSMQYSLNSSDGLDGTWSDCTANNTNVTFGIGKVYVRAKTQYSNFYLVGIIAPPATAPVLTGIGYDLAAGTLNGVNNNLQYRLNGGTWIDINTAPNVSGIVYIAGVVDIRTKPTATLLASQSATLVTVAPAANAPTLLYDDLANTITGLDATYEYKIGTGAWTVGNVAGDFSGAYTVQIRVKATSITLASLIQTISFTANLNLNVVGINIAAGQITGTTTSMQYSLNSSDGVDGTWTDCTNTNTTVTFTSGFVYVRAKAQVENFKQIAVISTAPAAPALTGITYDVSAKTISGVTSTMQYQLGVGNWTDTGGTSVSGVNFTEGDINIRTKATATTLASIAAKLATISPAPDAPTLAYDDVANTISGLNASYEYKIGNWAWTSGNITGDFTGTVTVQIRLKATAATLSGLIQTIGFTANLDLSLVTVDIPNSRINGTLTTMQYSLNSTNGTDGTWTDCTNTYTTVSYSNARSIYIRAKAQVANFLMLKTAAAAPAVTANTAGGQSAVKLVGATTLMEYSRNGGTTWTSVTSSIAGGTQAIDVSISPNNDLRVRTKATSGTLASLPTLCLNPSTIISGVGINVICKTITGTSTTMEYSLTSTTGTNGTWFNCTSPITLVTSFAEGNVYVRVKTQPTNYRLVASIAAQDVAPSAILSSTATTTGDTQIIMLDPTNDYEYVVDSNATLAGNDPGWSFATDIPTGSSIADDINADATQYIHIRVKGTSTQLPSAIKDIDVQLTDIKPAAAPNATVNDAESTAAYIKLGAVRASTTDGLEYNLDGNGWTDVLDSTTINLSGVHSLYVRVKSTTQTPSSNLTGDLDTTP